MSNIISSKKITFTEKVLEFLQVGVEATGDFLEMLTLSSGEFQREYKRFLGRGPRPYRNDLAEWYRRRKTYRTMLARLKRQGLIEKKEYGGRSVWKTTSKGADRLQQMRERRCNPFSLASARFASRGERQWTIVIFDIPEREKGKRRWLREALKSLQFAFLQRSVWIGKNGVPEEFMDAIEERKLLRYIHILTVKKGGTLEHIA